MTKRSHDKVTPPTDTEEAIQAAKDYWIKRHNEQALALGISAARLTQLGVPIPLVEDVSPDQLRLDVI